MSKKDDIIPEENVGTPNESATERAGTEDPNRCEPAEKPFEETTAAAPEAADAPVSEGEKNEPEENRFVGFFRNWGSAIIFLSALAFVCVLLGLAIGFGGDIYDKIAFIWVAAFVCEFITYLGNRNVKTLIAMIITIVLAVCSVVAYGLELAEIIP